MLSNTPSQKMANLFSLLSENSHLTVTVINIDYFPLEIHHHIILKLKII